VERDVPALLHVEEVPAFVRFLSFAASAQAAAARVGRAERSEGLSAEARAQADVADLGFAGDDLGLGHPAPDREAPGFRSLRSWTWLGANSARGSDLEP
jgi:hypothetical protein